MAGRAPTSCLKPNFTSTVSKETCVPRPPRADASGCQDTACVSTGLRPTGTTARGRPPPGTRARVGAEPARPSSGSAGPAVATPTGLLTGGGPAPPWCPPSPNPHPCTCPLPRPHSCGLTAACHLRGFAVATTARLSGGCAVGPRPCCPAPSPPLYSTTSTCPRGTLHLSRHRWPGGIRAPPSWEPLQQTAAGRGL